MKPFFILFFLLPLALEVACHKKEPRASQKDSVVLKINDVPIKADVFAKELSKQLSHFDALAAKDPQIIHKSKELLIENFIFSSILQQFAMNNKLAVTNEEVEKEFDQVRKSYPDDVSFRESLVSNKLSVEEWKDKTKKSLLEKKVFNVLSSQKPQNRNLLEAQAKKYYQTHVSEFVLKPQVKLQQIVVAKEDDALRLAQKIRENVSFADLAKKYSISPDGAYGGNVGYIAKGSVPAFEAAFAMRPGQISPIIKSNYGFHIIKVLDKKEGRKQSFDQVHSQILSRLVALEQQNIFKDWLAQELKKTKVERNDVLIESISVHTQGAKN